MVVGGTTDIILTDHGVVTDFSIENKEVTMQLDADSPNHPGESVLFDYNHEAGQRPVQINSKLTVGSSAYVEYFPIHLNSGAYIGTAFIVTSS